MLIMVLNPFANISAFSTEHDVNLCIRQFFSRRSGDISRSKLKDFMKANRTAMERAGFTLDVLPSAGAGFARNIPEAKLLMNSGTRTPTAQNPVK